MKRYTLLMLSVLAAAACSRELPQTEWAPVETRAGAGEPVEITATLPGIEGVETRAAYSADGKGGFTLAWQDGDVLVVGGQTFTLKSKSGKNAVFTGVAPSASRFDIVYGKVGDAPAAQTQSAHDDASHLQYGAVLKDVDSFENISFAHDWATAHGGTFRQSGILRLELNLPASVQTVRSLTLAGTSVPETVLTVTSGGMPANRCFVAYVQTDADLVFGVDDKLTLTVIDGEEEEYVNEFLPGPQTVHEGYVTTVKTGSACWQRTLNGPGSERSPYLIYTLEDLNNVRNLLSENTITHFRLMQDLDMSPLGSWKPYNPQGQALGIFFDGNGRTLSGLNCTESTFASFIGQLYGTVKDLTFSNPVIRTTSNSPCGVVCAWAGNDGGTLDGHLENVHVTGGTVTCSGTTHQFGGLCGRACNASFLNCSYDGTVERTGAASASSYVPVGGMLGQALSDVTVSGCSTSGSLTTKGGRSCGGVVGYCSVAMDITGCSSSMTLKPTYDVCGGICGYFGTGTVTDCTFTGTISVGKNSGSSYTGGIIAHTAGDITLLRCKNTGTVTGAENIVGGIIGQCNSNQTKGAVIRECMSTGKVTGGSVVGGIIGRASNVGDGLTMEDCFSTGDVVASGAYAGGLVGDLPIGATLTHCFATGSVSGSYAIGGVAGRAFGRQGSSASPATDVKTTVRGCIAWNPSVRTVTSAGENPANHYSGAAVVGFSSMYNTLSDNWRNPALSFRFYSDSSLDALFDQEDCGPDNALVRNGNGKWFYPYHGKAAGADETLSAVASRVGFPTTVWDLSGNVPALKCFQE